jgi:hypothetical protein
VHPAQHDHGLEIPVLAPAHWLWLPLIGGAVVVTGAALLRTVVPAQIRPLDPVVGAFALGTGLLVLLLAPDTVLPRPLVGVLVLGTATAVAATRALATSGGSGRLRPAQLLAPPLVVAALAAAVAVMIGASGTPPAGEPSSAVTAGLFVGIAGMVWVPLWHPRTGPGAALRVVSSWALAHVVLGATTAAALSALPA